MINIHNQVVAASVLAFCLTFNLKVSARTVEHAEWGKIFADNGCTGTFVLFDVEKNCVSAFNRPRAEKRYVPASTFKIANSLIALEVGAVQNADQVLPYGGKPQPFRSWEHDMSMRDAMKISNVAIYQEIARRIGLKRMRQWLQKLAYGNEQTGLVVDQFWLHGPLKISAIEQARFIARLAQAKLPLLPATQATVRQLIKQDDFDNLYAKTGWLTRHNPPIGWWVGFVEKDHKIYSFALNIDMADEKNAPKRLVIGKAILKMAGLLN